MRKSRGDTDRTIRIIVTFAIGVLTFAGVLHGTLAVVLLVYAVVFLLTGFVSFRPVYSLLGINTYKK